LKTFDKGIEWGAEAGVLGLGLNAYEKRLIFLFAGSAISFPLMLSYCF
jgi:hypothetical protein